MNPEALLHQDEMPSPVIFSGRLAQRGRESFVVLLYSLTEHGFHLRAMPGFALNSDNVSLKSGVAYMMSVETSNMSFQAEKN